jgi:hypothetical protein
LREGTECVQSLIGDDRECVALVVHVVVAAVTRGSGAQIGSQRGLELLQVG